MFIINQTDYSAHVIAGSYKVNNVPVCSEWTDANGTTHRQKIRDKVSGTFDMWFRSLTDYNAFLATIATNMTSAMTVPCTVEVNNANITKTSNFFIDHETVRNRDGAWDDYMERFTVTITEA